MYQFICMWKVTNKFTFSFHGVTKCVCAINQFHVLPPDGAARGREREVQV